MNQVKLLIATTVLALGGVTTSQAETVDMSKFTCEQLLQGTADSIEYAIWLSGYYNGLRKNAKLDMDQLKHNAEIVVGECKSNPKKTVMQTVNTLQSQKK
jgi:hypothetical protein